MSMSPPTVPVPEGPGAQPACEHALPGREFTTHCSSTSSSKASFTKQAARLTDPGHTLHFHPTPKEAPQGTEL